MPLQEIEERHIEQLVAQVRRDAMAPHPRSRGIAQHLMESVRLYAGSSRHAQASLCLRVITELINSIPGPQGDVTLLQGYHKELALPVLRGREKQKERLASMSEVTNHLATDAAEATAIQNAVIWILSAFRDLLDEAE